MQRINNLPGLDDDCLHTDMANVDMLIVAVQQAEPLQLSTIIVHEQRAEDN